jgi:hypothetical protein
VPLGHVPSLDNVFDRVRLTIAPLRYGAGLKGLAAGVPCVMTTVAAEGLDLPKKLQVLVADQPAEIAARVAKLCQDDAEYRRVVEACKAHVAANYSAERRRPAPPSLRRRIAAIGGTAPQPQGPYARPCVGHPRLPSPELGRLRRWIT